MTLIYSFDLDSTLADTRHRQHMIAADRLAMGDQDWVDYARACPDDGDGPAAPFLNAIIAQQGHQGHYVNGRDSLVDFIIVSRRDNAARDLTIEWLNARGWAPRELIMLKDKFYGSEARRQPQWKAAAIRAYERRRIGDQVVLHLDDFHEVTQYLISVGIPAMTVRGEDEGEYALGHAVEVTA